MSATNFTPIQLYRTSTAAAVPTAGNLASGELAINLTDEKLYFKNAAGTVKLLASTDTLGTVTSVAVSGGTTGLTTSGGPITTSGTITLAGTLGVANGGTGTNTAFTSGSVVFAGASGVYTQDNANFFWNDSTNRLGIGTASPLVRLHVSGGTGILVEGSGASGYNYAQFSNDVSNGIAIGVGGSTASGWTQNLASVFNASNNPIAFGTNNTERMRIDSSGNVGIGTASPGSRLDVGGGGNLLLSGASTGDQFIKVGSGRSGNGFSYIDIQGDTTYSNGLRLIRTNGGANTSSNIEHRGTGELQLITQEAGAITFLTTATERMRITSAGNVGIGTGTPGVKLEVVQNQATYSYFDFYNTTANGGIVFRQIYRNIANTGNATVDFAKLIGGGFALNNTDTNAANYTSFGVGASERMRIDSSGNVGIGTASPGNKLSVNGDASFGDSIFMGTGVSTGDCKIELGSNRSAAGNAYIDFHALAGQDYNGRIIRLSGTNGSFEITNAGTGAMTFSTNNGERMRIDGSGNVGIGTSSPAQKLEVNGITKINTASAVWEILQLVNTQGASGAYMQMVGSPGGSVAIGADATVASTMIFRTAGAEKARIDGSGAFLVGTTGGNVGYGGGAGFTVEPTGQMHNAVSGSTDCYYMQKDNTGGAYLKFFYGALNSPPSVVGDITTNGTGTSYNTSSDYRLKDINGPIANSGAYIDALKPVQGSWKADGSRFIGLLAHEVQEVSETPIATGEKDGEEMQAMDYSAPELIANLIAEVQSLRARVAQLEGN